MSRETVTDALFMLQSSLVGRITAWAGVQHKVDTQLPSRLKALHSIPSITKISINPRITAKRRAVCQQDPLMLILKWRKTEPPPPSPNSS